jgi:hypothetical protein
VDALDVCRDILGLDDLSEIMDDPDIIP